MQKIFGSSDSVRTYIGGKKIETNIAIIRSWRSQFGKIPARDFPDNRCYMTRLEIFNDRREYKIVRRVQRGKGA